MAEETPELYLSLKKTEKTKGEFKREYNEIRQRLIAEGKFKSTDKGLNTAILTEMGEFPYWKRGRSNQGPVPLGEGEFHQMSGGEARPFSARKVSQSKATKIRQDRLKKANELMIAAGFKSEVKLGKSKFSKDTKTPKGMAWDHKWEVQEFGPKYDRLIEDFASGSINEKEFKSRLSAHVTKNPGDIQRNLELKSQKDNLAKEASTRAVMKQESLADAYAVKDANYTEFQKLDDVTKTQRLEKAHQRALDITKSMKKVNKLNGISDVLANPPENYEVDYVARNGNGVNGNGVNGRNGNGLTVNGKNGNGLTVNGKNGKNGFLKGMENVNNYSGLGKLRDADQLANIGVNVSTGNYIGAGIGAATYGTSKALQNKQVQARVSKQIMKLVAERGTKTAAKMIPGLDILLSGKESWDYLKRGRWDQAGVAALSGAIGWIPIIGDGASAALDLSNTGLDIARLQAPTGKNKKNAKNRLSRYLRGFNN